MPTIDENLRIWNDQHHWSKDGDEWDDQAAFCAQPYDEWKKSIVETFIYSNIDENSNVLEIAPGHGRWTEFILSKAKRVTLVDLSPKCIEFCRDRFSEFDSISYYVNDGKTLRFIESNSIDFIWSYDSFVHMEKDVIESYIREFSRILKPGSKAIIHHAGRRNLALKLQFLQKLGRRGQRLYEDISWGKGTRRDGRRSNVSKEAIGGLAKQNGLVVEAQVDSWGTDAEYNAKVFGDYISILEKT